MGWVSGVGVGGGASRVSSRVFPPAFRQRNHTPHYYKSHPCLTTRPAYCRAPHHFGMSIRAITRAVLRIHCFLSFLVCVMHNSVAAKRPVRTRKRNNRNCRCVKSVNAKAEHTHDATLKTETSNNRKTTHRSHRWATRVASVW